MTEQLMVLATENIPAGSPLTVIGTSGALRQVAIADTTTDDVHGIAPKAIASGRRGWMWHGGECPVYVGATTVALDDPVTEGGDGYFGTGGTTIFGRYLGAKDANDIALTWLEDMGSIGEAAGGATPGGGAEVIYALTSVPDGNFSIGDSGGQMDWNSLNGRDHFSETIGAGVGVVKTVEAGGTGDIEITFDVAAPSVIEIVLLYHGESSGSDIVMFLQLEDDSDISIDNYVRQQFIINDDACRLTLTYVITQDLLDNVLQSGQLVVTSWVQNVGGSSVVVDLVFLSVVSTALA